MHNLLCSFCCVFEQMHMLTQRQPINHPGNQRRARLLVLELEPHKTGLVEAGNQSPLGRRKPKNRFFRRWFNIQFSALHWLETDGLREDGKKKHFVNSYQPSSSQLPTLSHLHIEEILRGAKKLNQILRGCSNGFNFDRYSIEIGRELLKGAIDLEESLRILVDLQEGSEHLITPQRKSLITLPEEDEDDDENTVKIADQKQLDRPRFSFDRPSRNYNDIQEVAGTDLKLRLKVLAASNSHSNKRSVSYGPDIKSITAFSEQNHSSSLQSKQEKSRIPNVITKLMGFNELPGNLDSKVTTKESGKQKVEGIITKKPARESTKKAEQRTKDSATLVLPPVKKKATLARNIPLIQDTVISKAGKTLTNRNGSTRISIHDKLPPQKGLEDIKLATSSRKAAIKIDKQQNDIAQLNHNSESIKDIQEKGRKQDSIKHREQKALKEVKSRNQFSRR
ncbi:uncharacterized protein LOC111299499 [Durio zibethinus]|uniref:Uncharacterized protein LOC111299499 n=1 Tax=Durio zibethinus TaxID=66656 RepID=A0A6P5ZD96_DURZI|nr:uncharacterized protein LOC111299499 [Durio zibethinus]